MASTAAAIRDRVRTLIEALLPTQLSADKLRSSRNEVGADFQDWAEKNPTSALRRFQARDDGEEDPPEVSNTDTDLRHFSIVVLVAYPQNARYGADQAMDRDDAMDSDWGLINGLGGIGIYGRANFFGSHDCTPLGAVKTRIRGAGVDFLEIRARFSYYRDVLGTGADDVPTSNLNTQNFRYTVASVASSYTIPLPAARADTNYRVDWSIADGTYTVGGQVPIADRTTAQFVLVPDAPLSIGDVLEFTVEDLT